MENQPADEQLIAEARDGRMSAFKALVERHEGKVAGVVKSMLGDTPEAVDVGQEVFIRFYESLEKFKGESSLGTYLVRIAINLSLNEIKRQKKKNSFFRPLEAGQNVAAEPSGNDVKELVRHAISQLENDFRVVVTLRMIEGYSTAETADILDVPQGTVLSRLSRAQEKLREALIKHTIL